MNTKKRTPLPKCNECGKTIRAKKNISLKGNNGFGPFAFCTSCLSVPDITDDKPAPHQCLLQISFLEVTRDVLPIPTRTRTTIRLFDVPDESFVFSSIIDNLTRAVSDSDSKMLVVLIIFVCMGLKERIGTVLVQDYIRKVLLPQENIQKDKEMCLCLENLAAKTEEIMTLNFPNLKKAAMHCRVGENDSIFEER